jgi:hypothetical protein
MQYALSIYTHTNLGSLLNLKFPEVREQLAYLDFGVRSTKSSNSGSGAGVVAQWLMTG